MENHFPASTAAQILLLKRPNFGCTKLVFEGIAAEQPGDRLTGDEDLLTLVCGQGTSLHISNAQGTLLEGLKVSHALNEDTIIDCAHGKFVNGRLSAVVRIVGVKDELERIPKARTNVFEANGVTYNYGRQAVLDQVGLDVRGCLIGDTGFGYNPYDQTTQTEVINVLIGPALRFNLATVESLLSAFDDSDSDGEQEYDPDDIQMSGSETEEVSDPKRKLLELHKQALIRLRDEVLPVRAVTPAEAARYAGISVGVRTAFATRDDNDLLQSLEKHDEPILAVYTTALMSRFPAMFHPGPDNSKIAISGFHQVPLSSSPPFCLLLTHPHTHPYIHPTQPYAACAAAGAATGAAATPRMA